MPGGALGTQYQWALAGVALALGFSGAGVDEKEQIDGHCCD